jgi:hypothetical protein
MSKSIEVNQALFAGGVVIGELRLLTVGEKLLPQIEARTSPVQCATQVPSAMGSTIAIAALSVVGTAPCGTV